MAKEITQEQMEDYRLTHLTAQVLLPLLEKKQQVAYSRLMGEFRNSRTADLALVAECNAYTSILEEITSKIKIYERLSKEKS